MSNKKKDNGKRKRTFAEVTAELKNKGSNKIPSIVEVTQISRLERALGGVKDVDHWDIFGPIQSELNRYSHMQKREITKPFLNIMFNGIYNSLSFVLHVSKDGGVVDFRQHFDMPYLSTMEKRLEFVDSLIYLTQSALNEREGMLLGEGKVLETDLIPKCKYKYQNSDIVLWGDFKNHYKQIQEIRNKIVNLDNEAAILKALIPKDDDPKYEDNEKAFLSAHKSTTNVYNKAAKEAAKYSTNNNGKVLRLTQEAYKRGTQFIKMTHQMISNGCIDKLFY